MPLEEIRPGHGRHRQNGLPRHRASGIQGRDPRRASQRDRGPGAISSWRVSKAVRLAETGVAQGMSGSPVYIDGRLIGAVSYSIGAFSKEPIAGITPIAEMKDATAVPRRDGSGSGAAGTADHARAALGRAFRGSQPASRRLRSVRLTCRPSACPPPPVLNWARCCARSPRL